jgi:hypothetical protein
LMGKGSEHQTKHQKNWKAFSPKKHSVSLFHLCVNVFD